MTRAKRKRGRPPLEDGVRSVEVSASVTEPDYYALQAIATAQRVPVAAVVRSAVRTFIRQRRRAALVIVSRPRRPRSVLKPGAL